MNQSKKVPDDELMKVNTIEVEKLDLKPGDVLVVRVDRKLKPAALARFEKAVKETLAKNGLEDIPFFCCDKEVHFTKMSTGGLVNEASDSKGVGGVNSSWGALSPTSLP